MYFKRNDREITTEKKSKPEHTSNTIYIHTYKCLSLFKLCFCYSVQLFYLKTLVFFELIVQVPAYFNNIFFPGSSLFYIFKRFCL